MRTFRATPHWARVALALALLNASLTLVNVWPTPFVRLSGDLSLEVLGVAALLVLLHRVVTPRKGLVEKDEARLGRQRTSNFDSSTFTAGKRSGRTAANMAYVQFFEKAFGAEFNFVRRQIL